MNLDQSNDLAAEIASENEYRVLEIASRKARMLALVLQGGRRASPNVEQPLRLANELGAWLRAVRDRWPSQQRPPEQPKEPVAAPEDADLPTMMSGVGRDARYLKYLTRGGMGMQPNVVEPLRVLAALVEKLEAVHARWLGLQGPDAFTIAPVRRSPGQRITDEMIASGELKIGRAGETSAAFKKLVTDAERRGGIRPDYGA